MVDGSSLVSLINMRVDVSPTILVKETFMTLCSDVYFYGDGVQTLGQQTEDSLSLGVSKAHWSSRNIQPVLNYLFPC